MASTVGAWLFLLLGDSRMITALFIASVVSLLAFFLLRGWTAMLRWHRVYVVIGLPIFIIAGPLASSLEHYLGPDKTLLGSYYLALVLPGLFLGQGAVAWWGFAVCFSQVRMLLHQPN